MLLIQLLGTLFQSRDIGHMITIVLRLRMILGDAVRVCPTIKITLQDGRKQASLLPALLCILVMVFQGLRDDNLHILQDSGMSLLIAVSDIDRLMSLGPVGGVHPGQQKGRVVHWRRIHLLNHLNPHPPWKKAVLHSAPIVVAGGDGGTIHPSVVIRLHLSYLCSLEL